MEKIKFGGMTIELNHISVREVSKDFIDDAELGCTAYGGKLNVRPAFQREFVYNYEQRNKVIETVKKGFPLNVMYWVKNSDGTFEMLDGQQRTISICQYVNNEFSLDDERSFANLTEREQNQILDYKLVIYICEGDDKEKLDWFQTINIAGEKLTAQEMRNAIFSCEWLNNAKKYFSRNGCLAQVKYRDYLKGSPIRQEYLETALKWIADREGLENLEKYMDKQKLNKVKTAEELWNYFENIFAWVEKIFPKYRKEMKGLQWGILFNKYGKNDYSDKNFEPRISELMSDFDVTKKAGIYEYLLDGEKNEKFLSIRQFNDRTKTTIYEQQGGKCAICGKSFDISEMHADHKIAWSKGGKTVAENCQVLCSDCNLKKSNK